MSLSLTWLGHSTVVLDGGGVRLISDPLLGRHAGLLRRRGGAAPAAGAYRAPDAVLLSHLHHDHAELRSLRLLAGTPVLTAPANAHWLRRRRIGSAVGLGPLDWFGVPGGAGDGARVRLAPAVHGHRPMPHRPNAANGHLVRLAGLTVWVVGDTELFAGIARLPELAGGPIDLAVVPISGWGPRLSGGHLGPADAARACALVGARIAVPVHWGTLHAPAGRNLPRGWMDVPGSAFAAAVERHAPGCRALVLAPGESALIG